MMNSSLGNKEVFSKNLRKYIEKSGKDRKELAEIWGFPYSTVTEWINGKKYPRIDRIEKMASYFGILKSDLIEDKEIQEKPVELANELADIYFDPELMNMIREYNLLSKEKKAEVRQFVTYTLRLMNAGRKDD